MKLFTSDWHLNHKRVLEYCERPFDNMHDMECVFYENLKSIYRHGDILYYLGDLCFASKFYANNYIEWFSIYGLNQVIYIFGNHDYSFRNTIKNNKIVKWSGDLKVIHLHDGTKTYLCHFPIESWPKGYMLHGHSHGNLEHKLSGRLDVSIDNAYKLLGEYRPFTEDEVIEICKDGYE